MDYTSKGQTLNAGYYSSLLVQLKDILKETLCGKFTKGSRSCTTVPLVTGHLQRGVVFTDPILRFWPLLKKQSEIAIFSSDPEVIFAAET
jgi:hypothetical protein